jgi:hypothetical protein
MKIVRHPYQASIVPKTEKPGALWHVAVHVDGSADAIAHHEAVSKEDAACTAMLELVRLQRKNGTAKAGSPELRRA